MFSGANLNTGGDATRSLQRSSVRWLAELPTRFPVQVGVALLANAVLVPLATVISLLPEASYRRPLLLWEAMARPASLILLLAMAVPLLVAHRRLAWSRVDPGGRTRIVVVVTAAVLAWMAVTGSHNAFFDQSYDVDRILLILLVLGIWRHPSFSLPFLLLWLAVFFQVFHPLPEPGWHWPDKRLPVDLLFVFVAYLYAAMLLRPRRTLLPFLILCVVGSEYAQAGINKVLLGPHGWSWVAENQISNIAVSAYVNGGWLRGLGDGGIVRLAGAVGHLDPALAATTLCIELGAMLLLLRMSLTRAVLVGFIALHLGILTLTGIFFWKWIIVVAVLVWYVGTLRDDGEPGLFNGPNAALAALVMAAAPLYFYSVPFAWWDTPYVNHFEIWGETVDGDRQRLDPRFFAPYDIVFQQSRFYYLRSEPVLVGTYGTSSSYEVLKGLEGADAGSALSVTEDLGRRFYDATKAEVFEAFLHAAVDPGRRRQHPLLRRLAPPYHFQTTLHESTYSGDAALAAIEVTFQEHFFDGERLSLLREGPVLRVDLKNADTESR